MARRSWMFPSCSTSTKTPMASPPMSRRPSPRPWPLRLQDSTATRTVSSPNSVSALAEYLGHDLAAGQHLGRQRIQRSPAADPPGIWRTWTQGPGIPAHVLHVPLAGERNGHRVHRRRSGRMTTAWSAESAAAQVRGTGPTSSSCARPTIPPAPVWGWTWSRPFMTPAKPARRL